MGKTQPTYRDLVREERGNWAITRKWLRRQYRPAFDRMWEHADNYSDAIGEANPRNPMEGILLGICLGQQQELAKLERSLDELADEE